MTTNGTLTPAQQNELAATQAPCPSCREADSYSVHPKPVGIGRMFMAKALAMMTCCVCGMIQWRRLGDWGDAKGTAR